MIPSLIFYGTVVLLFRSLPCSAGGSRVESFVFSDGLSSDLRGSQYEGVFHVTDWFPTILSMTNSDFKPDAAHPFDGIDNAAALLEGAEPPRNVMLYNYYDRVQQLSGDIWTDTPMAIRNAQYKLMHTYDSNTAGAWYTKDQLIEDDDEMSLATGCSQTTSFKGTFKVR